MSKNQLKHLPESFGNLKSLERLRNTTKSRYSQRFLRASRLCNTTFPMCLGVGET